MTPGEDASRVRVGQGPNVLALLRDTALNLLHGTGYRTIAARFRHYCRCPLDLFTLLGLPLPQHVYALGEPLARCTPPRIRVHCARVRTFMMSAQGRGARAGGGR